MRALSSLTLAVTLSLFAAACAHTSNPPTATAPEPEPATEPRPPPGTRLVAWPDLGAWSGHTTRRELPGSSDPFLWQRPAEPTPPKAQVPLRLHRPID